MADVIEYVYLSDTAVRDNRIDWRLEDDSVESGIWAVTDVAPNRFVLELTSISTAATIVIDSSEAPYSLGEPGDGSDTFSWDAATSIVTIYLGGLDPDDFPVGSYSAALHVYSADYPNGLRWGRQAIYFVLE